MSVKVGEGLWVVVKVCEDVCEECAQTARRLALRNVGEGLWRAVKVGEECTVIISSKHIKVYGIY